MAEFHRDRGEVIDWAFQAGVAFIFTGGIDISSSHHAVALAPEPLRGRRNEPAYLKYTAQKVAEIKGISPEEVALVTSGTAMEFFRLDETQ
jgi:Tat protein secretion system quality control protein TatD with DNase activity